MNATLQCLSQIEKLTNYYFKYSERVKEIMKNYKTNNTLYLIFIKRKDNRKFMAF